MSERQFKRFFEEARRMRGDTAENLVGLLERRLDTVVYRANFVPTMFAARQLVNHGHVLVNGKRVNIPSYLVNEGDVIEIREKSRNHPLVVESLQNPERDVPDYISLDAKNMRATFLRCRSMGRCPIRSRWTSIW
ncbi:30S ribosomal protein S4 [bacterium HR39]|nr:30S ribosomal protein S4 [bacterium HR39]